MRRFAIDKALADTRATALIYAQNGIVRRGTPTRSPTISSPPSGNPLSAEITDCVDSTNWQPVYSKTGKSAAAPGQAKRVIVESTAEMFAGRWVIQRSVAHRDRTC